MKCPSCQRPVDHEAESCYSCGYSCTEAMRKFGANQVMLKRIHDAADCLRVSDTREISEQLDALEERFPQILFTTYLGELNGKISISELGFWLLNRSRIENSSLGRPNDNGILLIIDVESQQAGLSLGYLPELLLTEDDCMRALMASRGFLVNGEFGNAVITLFSKLEKSLAKKARKLRGLTRDQQRTHLMRSSQRINSLALPRPYIPVQFEESSQQSLEVDKPENRELYQDY